MHITPPFPIIVFIVCVAPNPLILLYFSPYYSSCCLVFLFVVDQDKNNVIFEMKCTINDDGDLILPL